MNEKEKRCPNFTEAEKSTLLHLVYQYRQILENKKTDATNNQKKADAWSKIAAQFNATSGRAARNSQNLRGKYDDLKKNLRKKMGNAQRELFQTGVGQAPQVKMSSDEELLLSLIGPSTCGLQDRGGGDKTVDLKQ